MTTLQTVALNCAKQLGRADAAGLAIIDLESEIREQVGESVKFYNRKPWGLTEVRGAELVTVANQTWYSTIDLTTGSGNQEVSGRSTASADDILDIIYARQDVGPSGLNEPIYEMKYSRFERLFEGSTPGSNPTHYTRFAGQIGIWPTPDSAYTLYMSVAIKPPVPTVTTDTSVWFDEAQELIEAATCKRISAKYLRDDDLARRFEILEQDAASGLNTEYVYKRTTGRLTPHD
ncbi:MAG: hypothetical protein AAFR21_11610 [Pseudomonadota bacterium]